MRIQAAARMSMMRSSEIRWVRRFAAEGSGAGIFSQGGAKNITTLILRSALLRASRRMATGTAEQVAILRDAPQRCGAPQDEVRVISHVQRHLATSWPQCVKGDMSPRLRPQRRLPMATGVNRQILLKSRPESAQY